MTTRFEPVQQAIFNGSAVPNRATRVANIDSIGIIDLLIQSKGEQIIPTFVRSKTGAVSMSSHDSKVVGPTNSDCLKKTPVMPGSVHLTFLGTKLTCADKNMDGQLFLGEEVIGKVDYFTGKIIWSKFPVNSLTKEDLETYLNKNVTTVHTSYIKTNATQPGARRSYRVCASHLDGQTVVYVTSRGKPSKVRVEI